jgi:prepilin-type N-terminal cleavage/methylation domain-containing protein
MKAWNNSAFTIVELAVVLAVLSIMLLAAGILLLNTMDTYAKVTSTTNTVSQARHCLEVISHEMRESIGDPDVADVNLGPLTNPGDPIAPVTDDAMLLTSARRSDGGFSLTAASFPLAESIILYYLNTTPEGDTQLLKHQIYYIEDLHTDTGPLIPPFTLANPAYAGSSIVIEDGNSVQIAIDRSTGTIGGTAPTRPPRVLMNRTESFDIVNDGVNPIEIRLSCQVMDRFDRTTTTRLVTEIEPRNDG